MQLVATRSLTARLAAPILAGSVGGTTQVNLSWSAPTPTGQSVVAGRRLYRATNPSGPFSLIATPSGTAAAVTGLTAATTYYFYVEYYDQYQTGIASNTVSVTTTSAAGSLIRWHPGHYLFVDGILRPETLATLLPQFLTRITELGAETYVTGVKVFIQASALEGATQGDFTAAIALLRTLADRCRLVGMRLWVSMLHIQFGGWDPSHLEKYFPAYMLVAPYGTTTMSNGITLRVWQQATMDRVIAQTQALLNADNGHGVAFKDDPILECMQIDETSIAVSGTTDGFSNTNVAIQYARWMTAARAAAPNMQFRLTANFLSAGTDPDQVFADLIQTAANLDIGVGGPDTIPNQSIQANRIFTGMVPLHPTDFRGVVPWIAEVQSPSMGGTKGDHTAQALYNWMVNGGNATVNNVVQFQQPVRPQLIVWYDKRWDQGATGGLRSDQPRTGDGSESILTFIERTQGAVYSTACPSGFPGCAT